MRQYYITQYNLATCVVRSIKRVATIGIFESRPATKTDLQQVGSKPESTKDSGNAHSSGSASEFSGRGGGDLGA